MEPMPLFITYLDPEGREKVYHLRDTLLVGRAPECALRLREEGVSRRHCRFRRAGGTVVLEDLDSTNGTYLNGAPVKAAEVHPGDRVTVGSCTLYVSGGEAGSAGEAGRTLRLGSTTIRVLLRAAEETRPDGPSLRRAGLARDHVETLFRLTELATTASDPEELHRAGVNLLMDLFGMDLGCVIEAGPDPDAFTVGTMVNRSGRPGYGPSRTVVRRVLAEDVSVLAAGAVEKGEGVFDAPSVAGPGTASIMCVPIRTAGAVRGAIYLSALEGGAAESTEALRLLVSMVSQLGLAVENLRHLQRLERENQALRTSLPGPARLVGRSRAMEAVRRLVEKVAPTDATVLITGESGTGKEVAAAAVHALSPRRERPMICLNCGAIPESMVESELFGHERGAFTGAHSRRLGKFELASEGTLFLDEVGELPPAVQVKLLRALEQQRFFRVGGERPVTVNVRVVAATNADLDRRVEEGKFRRDLYYRLKVFRIHLPPLRERLEDLSELATVLLERIPGGRRVHLTEDGLARLRSYDWPGNVRELLNVLEREVILAEGDALTFRDLLPDEGARGPAAAMPATLREVERTHLLQVLRATGWNKKAAAEILGIGRATVYDKMKQHGIREGD